MPLDGKDSDSTWQGTQAHNTTDASLGATWEPSDEEDVPQDQDEPFTDPARADALHLGATHLIDEENAASRSSARSELLGQLGYYLSLIGVPLLFATLTCLIVLPLMANNRAKLPPQGIIPIVVIILMIALAQGVAIYYAGTNNGLWAAYTISGFFLFLLVGCFALFGPVAGFILLIILVGLTLLLSRLYVHPVREGYIDIVQAYGKYSRTLYPGFNILLPWEKISHHLTTRETTWHTPVQHVQMSKNDDVVLRGSITYQLQPVDAHLAALNVKKWEESLQTYFVAAIQNVAATFSPEDFIAWPQGLRSHPTIHSGAMALAEGEPRWQQVNGLVFQRVRDRVALWGVIISDVRLYDIAIVPHAATLLDATTTVPISPQPSATTQQPQSQPAQPPKETPVRQEQPAQMATSQAPAQSMPPTGNVREEILRKAYTEIQSGKIKDPDTIRSLAEKFESIAKDPVASQSVSFDAARAALNLYAEARRREEEESANAGTLFTDETNPDWSIRRSADENLNYGG